MLRLESGWTESMVGQPESGMGYQVVDVEQFDGLRRRGIAYNAELVIYDTEPYPFTQGRSYRSLLTEARSASGLIRSIAVVGGSGRPAVHEVRRAPGKPTEAKDAPIEATAVGEVFKRFSAYEHDHRITKDGRFLPGTYATTEADAMNVSTGSEAVQRYALPNPMPASWVFTSSPNAETAIQRGIVAPAFDQPGGGVEVIFPVGTQASTSTGPVRIPD